MNSKRHGAPATHRRSTWIFGLPLALVALGAAASCSSTPAPTGIASACSIASDCSDNLICVFGRCHVACETSKDCGGEACLPQGVCELAQEQNAKCTATLPCVTGVTCEDDVCRTPCTLGAAVGALGGCLEKETCTAVSKSSEDVCIDNSTDGGKGSKDGATNDSSSDAHAKVDGNGGNSDARGDDGASDATMPDAKGDGSSGIPDGTASTPDGSSGTPDGGSSTDATMVDATNSCPSAQTQFGNTITGDVNAHFQSGVAARTTSDLFILSGYVGPDPAADGGGGAINAVYAQDFDLLTGLNKGPAQLLFRPPNVVAAGETSGENVIVYSAAVAPTGQIALVYLANFSGTPGEQLYAAFLDASPADAGTSDGGAAGLQLEQVVSLEAASVSGQPYVVWSDAIQAFVVSWEYNPGWFVAVNRFLVGGQNAGSSTDPVPTNDPSAYVRGVNSNYNLLPNYASGSLGGSGNLFGVAYIDNSIANPALTVLDAIGNPVGKSFEVVPASPDINGNWVAVAGVANGFVYFYDNTQPASVAEVFVPTSGDAGVVGGFSDAGGGDAGGFPTFNFTGAVRAYAARAVADETGGAGGVGLALQYPTKVSFAYVNADGVTHQGPNSVFAHTYGSGDIVSMTNFGGSFVISLYNASAQSTQVAASGCP